MRAVFAGANFMSFVVSPFRRQRFMALFLCLSFVWTLFIPPLSVYAESLSHKGRAPGALATGKSNVKLATDANKPPFSNTQDTPLSADTADGPGKPQKSKHEEIVSKRTANTKTFDLGNGKFEVRNYMGPVHFKENGKWKQIDTSLVEDTNAAESTNPLGKAIAFVKGKTQTLHTYKVKANDWQAKFAASNDSVGMVRIEADGKKISFSPRDAKEGVVPDVRKNVQGIETVTYKDLWPGVDVVYSVKNEMLKEEILLKSQSATTDFAYDISGASLVKNKTGGFDISGTKQSLTELSVTLQKAGPTSEKVISQDYKNGVLHITLNKSWLKNQASDQFPVVIDPSVTNSGTVSWNYTAYKSDGYVCSSSVCYMNAGELYDNSWKNWRTIFCPGDMSFLSGKVVTYASMYLQQADRSYLVGYNGDRYFSMQHASYFGYNGIDGGVSGSSALINFAGSINVTSQVQFEVNRGDFGACWALWGEEYAAYTYKGFDPDISYMHYEYSTTPATPTVVTPQNGQTFTDPQVSFKINPVTDAEGDPVQYYYRIATGSDGESGTVINSGDVSSTQWTVPDGVLQDGQTYYLHVYSRDPYAYSAPSAPIKFTIDSRQGKDKTQTYDAVGPASIDLTNGNVSTSISSHATSALGGNIGVSLDYNAPLRSRQGLVGTYWNNTSESGDAVLTRVDKNVSFNWDTGSPSEGLINTDSFSARWTGFFVAPTAGTYYFGGSNDDGMTVTVNNQVLYNQGCYSGICYDTTKSVTLTAGQVVPIQIDFAEGSGLAYANLYVKGAVLEQIVPQAWLQTGARPIAQPHGLTGSYYANNAGYNLDASGKQLLVKRLDTALSFNWGTAGPVPGSAASDFMVRWTGYIKLSAGDYTFGTNADDGARITINGTTVADNYTNGCCTEKYGATTHFNAGTYPIQIDYYDSGGPASLYVMVKANGATTGQIVPSSWLTPNAQTLPAGWQLGIDPDGNLNYDHITIGTNSATLSDSTGDTHVYTWTGSAYKPPVNEDGQLTRNADGTTTLIDSDGRTYVFAADGTLASVTSPTDDRQPAALQYTYAGTPAHITKIADGVDSNRYAAVYYAGDGKGKCVAPPDSSYIDPADDSINGYICAVQTNDGRTTSFFYSLFGGTPQLSLVVKPGDERTSYQYDAGGMLTAVRSSLAEDAITAGVRTNDDSVLTQLGYDALGRATSVTAPAANAGDTRQQQTIEYDPGYTLEHIVGAAEPKGYSRRVDYDGLFRATKDTDVTGNATTQQWDSVKDLLYSTTDATGLKSTTIYDTDDRPTDSYGPAPTAWFGSDNKPLAAYVSQVPHTSTGYDEGITGPAVSYMKVTNRASSRLETGQSLTPGQSLVSQDGRFTFIHQLDGNLVTYGPSGVVWASNTGGRATTQLVMQADGNLVLYNGGTPIWATSSNSGGTHPVLIMQNDGNLVVYNDSGARWASGTGGQTYAGSIGNNVSLNSNPLLHSTNIGGDPSMVTHYFGTTGPISNVNDHWGMRMTGKLRLPTTGNWGFRIWSDNGVRMTIDDQVVIDDWNDGGERNHPTYVYNNTTANTPHRFTIDYYHLSGAANFGLYMTPPGGSETQNVAQYFTPDYGLQTSQTIYGAPTSAGQTATLTATTNYGSTPEYGLAQTTTSDTAGLTLTATNTYEAPGTGYLRQTSSSLPGGATTAYSYYGATDTVDNPCTTDTVEVYRQGGMLHTKTEPDPDGAGPLTGRVTETIYDDSGKVVATRYNSDPWTCTTYDARERVLTTSIPARGQNQPARTITNNYAVGGNPLVVSSSDDKGTITVQTDLLGRTTSYTDIYGDTTTSTYDTQGRLASRSGPLGTETFVYDDYNRLVDQKLDSATYAHVTYDTFSRIDNVTYPAVGQEKVTYGRDTLGRLNSLGYTLGDGTAGPSDQVTRAATGDIISGTELGQAKLYTYDTAGRLTGATVAGNTFTYGYGAQDASCADLPGTNTAAGKDSNRTSQTINGVTTTYCYDQADRLIASSNADLTSPVYDDHGNLIQLGSGTNPLRLPVDSSDRNRGVEQYDDSGNGTAYYYDRDVQGRIIARHKNTISNWSWTAAGDTYYGFTDNGDTPDFLRDSNGNVTEKYLHLAGGVLLTIRPAQTGSASSTYSLPNIHGDVFATTDASGTVTGTYQTGPFGEQLPGQTSPGNTTDGTTFGYVGQHQKLTETAFSIPLVQMGARLYLPSLGRFASVDPIQGGTPNNYVYPTDPVNETDLTGMWSIRAAWKKLKASVVALFSKNTSQSGRGYQNPSSKEWDAYYKSKASRNLSREEVKNLRQWNNKARANEKYQGERNRQKRNRDDDGPGSNPTAPPNIGPNPYLSDGGGNNNAAKAVILGGGALAGGGILWWSLKAASPVCGPGVLVCAVAF